MPFSGVEIVALFREAVTVNRGVGVTLTSGASVFGCDGEVLDMQPGTSREIILTMRKEKRLCCHRRHRRFGIDLFPLIEKALRRSGYGCLLLTSYCPVFLVNP